MARNDTPQNPDGVLEVVNTPVDAVTASQTIVEQVSHQGFDTFPNQFAEEVANARVVADATAAGARDGAAAALVAQAAAPGGVSHLREQARAEAAKAYQAAYDAAAKQNITHVEVPVAPVAPPIEQQQAVNEAAVNTPNDRPV